MYEEEGNLVQKVKKNGDTWTSEYSGNGMMSKVTFKYDSLGRRIEKSSTEKVMNFVWDGNTILHEYFSHNDSERFEDISKYSSQNNLEIPDNIATWVFNDGFVPAAKITSQGNDSIISDYLGSSVEAYDEKGNRVWSAELDIYGRVEEFTGEKDFIPFWYQGQYEDAEIGLYYNRFRYYDPGQGNYTQQDPIGLAGNNPTIYGYVHDPNGWVDVFGLTGTYIFTDGTTYYIGQGPVSGGKNGTYNRMYDSMRQRVGGYKNVTKGLHLDFGDRKMGFIVEHLLMDTYGAMDARHFANDPVINSPGKKHLANASKEIKEQAKNYAEYMKFKFDIMSHGDGIKKMSMRGCR